MQSRQVRRFVLFTEPKPLARVVKQWFARFRNGDFNLKDRKRSGRPRTVDDDQITTVVDANQHLTIRKMSHMLNVNVGAVHKHLEKKRYVNRADI